MQRMSCRQKCEVDRRMEDGTKESKGNQIEDDKKESRNRACGVRKGSSGGQHHTAL